MEQKFGSLIQRIIVGSIITVSYITPALAQQALTRAEVYQLSNQVQLLLQDKPPRIAKKADVLVPLDALQTKAESAADLVFNERSLAKIGSSSTFRFKPGLRRFELPGGGYKAETIFELKNGIALILTPSGSTGTTIETPQSRIEIIASAALPKQLKQSDILPPTVTSGAVIVAHDSDKKLTRVFNLTNQEIKVATLDSTQFKFLKSGQTVSVNNGVISTVEDFNLSKFYQTTKIAVGLGPGQEGVVAKEEERIRKILQEVRKETLAAVETQKIRLEGLCTLNGRGGASTLSTNCITTNEGDPIGKTSGDRESVTPPRNNPPVNNPPVNNPTVNNPPVNNPTVNNPLTGGRGANIQGGGNNPIP